MQYNEKMSAFHAQFKNVKLTKPARNPKEKVRDCGCCLCLYHQKLLVDRQSACLGNKVLSFIHLQLKAVQRNGM